jgi:anti-sigma factor RsiW
VRCDFADSLLQSYFDGELSAVDSAEFGRHIIKCADCSAELLDMDVLSGRLRLSQIYTPAPVSLQQKIDAKVRSIAKSTSASQRLVWRYLAPVAVLLVAAIVLWKVVPTVHNDDYQAELAAEIVDAHLRSLQPGDVTGFASSDEHVLKEWFDAKVKFAFPVHDFANRGFPLKGGRVELLEGRSVAALVYDRNGRLINVFVWPTRGPDLPAHTGSQRGFQWVAWRKDKMEFCAVSDTDPADLEQLRQLIHSITKASRP